MELMNTLFVQTQGAYLHLDHETVRVEQDRQLLLQVPLLHLGGLGLLGNIHVSPGLLHRCAQEGRDVVWFDMNGRFRARLSGAVSGNVLLRRAQHRALEDETRALHVARRMVWGKVRNARTVLLRGGRERGERSPRPGATAAALKDLLGEIERAPNIDVLRGLEGQAAALYLGTLGDLIVAEGFPFNGRNKRPPRDPVNALLSFCYALLAADCASALEGVGLDPQVGYLHALRPGRPALALDLMEEFRAWVADRLVLALLNLRQLTPKHFEVRPGGAVFLNEEGRKGVLVAYQKRKQEEIQHPLLRQDVPQGLLPHAQARLLAQYLRGDRDEYVPFVGK